ncbi:MAG TPA: GAF domain-containing sensor histidine kinase [Spirochaetota bacterium]|nr:GAF domain-containing sensor histidine kinase [Spirochaetota bacterium]HPN13490.1 GAF domain-containing sensor histidine kinase [Spirochaetota bacterium]HQL84094.1 GAF domain-containing sensor histidine kinase [Spirochaetota bacterium]
MNKTGMNAEDAGFIDEIRRTMTGGASLEDLMPDLLAGIRRMIACNRLDVGLMDEKGRRIEVRHLAADYGPLFVKKGHTADVPEALSEKITREGHVTIDDLEGGTDSDGGEGLLDLLVREGIRSVVAVPVIAGEAVGFIACSSRTSGAFNDHAVAVLKELAKILRYQVEKEYHLDQIEKNYQAYMEMLGFVSHELKSPVSSIVTLVTTLSEGYYGKMDEKQREILSRIVKKAEYLEALTSQYLNLARFESSMMESNPGLIDFMEDIVEPAIELLMPQIEERGMRLERDYRSAIIPVRCDPALVKIVMVNLLSNGIKYGNKGGTLKVSVTKGFKKFSFSVWNEGPGFNEEDKHRLFKKFSRLQAAELIERKGSGIGLYVSWKIVQIHCGHIYAESEQGSWARFTVELPLYLDLCIMEK